MQIAQDLATLCIYCCATVQDMPHNPLHPEKDTMKDSRYYLSHSFYDTEEIRSKKIKDFDSFINQCAELQDRCVLVNRKQIAKILKKSKVKKATTTILSFYCITTF
jgi:tmRNA-binding protein